MRANPAGGSHAAPNRDGELWQRDGAQGGGRLGRGRAEGGEEARGNHWGKRRGQKYREVTTRKKQATGTRRGASVPGLPYALGRVIAMSPVDGAGGSLPYIFRRVDGL